MNWDAIGAIGEIVGAIAVLLTLFYLSIQIRQGVKLARSQIREQRTMSSQEWLYQYAAYGDLVAKAGSGEPLTGGEKLTMNMLFRAQFRGYEAYLHHYLNGLFDEGEWQGMKQTIRVSFRNVGFVELWEEIGNEFSPELQQLVEEVIRERDA